MPASIKMYAPDQADHRARSHPQHQMLKEYSFKPLALKLPSPGQQPGCYYRQSGKGSQRDVVIRHRCKNCVPSPLPGEVKSNPGQEQCDGKVYEHHMLGVPCQQGGFQIKWVHHDLLDHNLSCHLGMN